MNGEVEIRVLGATSIEDHYAHLLRLDPDSRYNVAPNADDHAIDAHCLHLMSAQAILIGAYIDGIMRVALELVPDRTARRAEAVFTAEPGFRSADLAKKLVAHAAEQARKYHFCELQFHGLEQGSRPIGA